MDLLGTKGPKSSDFKAFLKKLPGLDKRFQHVKMYEDSMFEEGTQPAISSLAPD
jgi:hypothetical protein